LKRGAWLIWHSVIWVIWISRNDRIFNNNVKEVDEMVEEIKMLSWNWSLNRLKSLFICFTNGVGIRECWCR
jgi:hypothetical protein